MSLTIKEINELLASTRDKKYRKKTQAQIDKQQSMIGVKRPEQSARMVAMKAASDNAKKVIDDLQLSYNKARQASITKELSEIVSGAAAV